MRKILVIDDEEDICAVASLAMEFVAGWTAVTASSGSEGIEIARRERPDAILMDMTMPGMDGPTTFHEIQKSRELSVIPVVLFTAKVQPAERRDLYELGAAAVLFKPFDPLTLAGELAEALGWCSPLLPALSRPHRLDTGGQGRPQIA